MDYQNKELKYWIGLSRFPKFGTVRLSRLSAFFPNISEAYTAPVKALMAAGLEEKIAQEFASFRTTLNPDYLLEQLIKEQITVTRSDEDDYPEELKNIFNPPFLIYTRGQLKPLKKIAVVGTRKFSPYGKQAVQEIIPTLARTGLGIVSGLALGIDALAHEATLDNLGYTIGVLGSGIDARSIYPASNRYLSNKIIDNEGCLLSEFAPGTPPLKHHFPMRNRIISGLSFGTLVIEAAEQSGSLITAQLALEQNREVFAVPGNIYSPLSAGTNKLIKQGAIPVTSAEDILSTLDLSGLTSYSSKKYSPENPEESLILSFLSKEAVHIDELIRRTNLPTSQLSSAIILLEMKGAVKNLGGMRYITN